MGFHMDYLQNKSVSTNENNMILGLTICAWNQLVSEWGPLTN